MIIGYNAALDGWDHWTMEWRHENALEMMQQT
jgi:hypothetical protein